MIYADHNFNGKLAVDDGVFHHTPVAIEMCYWPGFGLHQFGNGQTFTPEQYLKVGQSAKVCVDGYEITVKRVDSKAEPKIIGLSQHKRRKI